MLLTLWNACQLSRCKRTITHPSVSCDLWQRSPRTAQSHGLVWGMQPSCVSHVACVTGRLVKPSPRHKPGVDHFARMLSSLGCEGGKARRRKSPDEMFQQVGRHDMKYQPTTTHELHAASLFMCIKSSRSQCESCGSGRQRETRSDETSMQTHSSPAG